MMTPIIVLPFIFLILMLPGILAVSSFIYFQLLRKKQIFEKNKIKKTINNEITKTLYFINRFSSNMPAGAPVQKLLNELNWRLQNNVNNILGTIDKDFSNAQ